MTEAQQTTHSVLGEQSDGSLAGHTLTKLTRARCVNRSAVMDRWARGKRAIITNQL